MIRSFVTIIMLLLILGCGEPPSGRREMPDWVNKELPKWHAKWKSKQIEHQARIDVLGTPVVVDIVEDLRLSEYGFSTTKLGVDDVSATVLRKWEMSSETINGENVLFFMLDKPYSFSVRVKE